MMYRRYTTTGTNKFSPAAKEGAFIFVCLSFLLFTRFYFLLSGQMTVTDHYGYYQASMIQAGERAPVMTSGAALAYSGSLSVILRFTGNRMDAVFYYHIFLQVLAFCFLYFGYRRFFGKAVSVILMLLYSLSPWLMTSTFRISPENYYLTVWSFWLLFFGLAVGKRSGTAGILLSLLTGVFLGVILGGGCILIKYGKAGGSSFSDAVPGWSRGLIRMEGGRWQDMELWLPLWLIGSLLAGELFRLTVSVSQKRKERTDAVRPEAVGETEKETEEEDQKRRERNMESAAEGEKKIKYIENPLPLPKKHVKRRMDFKLDEKDDFDIEIDEKDDFDI